MKALTFAISALTLFCASYIAVARSAHEPVFTSASSSAARP